MAHLTTLTKVGGMLHAPIPRQLVRQLGLQKHDKVAVEAQADGTLRVSPLENWLRERRRLSKHSAR